MRAPNPPAVILDHLSSEERTKVIRLALLVVYALGEGRDYSAYEMIDYANLEQDEVLYTAFWSLLDSQQRNRIKSQSELAHK